MWNNWCRYPYSRVFAKNNTVANITVDGGATGNFILKGVAEQLGLKIEKLLNALSKLMGTHHYMLLEKFILVLQDQKSILSLMD